MRKSKQSQTNKLAEKLKSEQQCSKNWWTTLKSFINPGKTSSFPPLQVNDSVLSDDGDKANLLNDNFRNQTVINDGNVEVPVIADYNLVSHLHDIILTPDEIEIVLKSLPLGKAAGSDGINNKNLKGLANTLSLLFVIYLIGH